MYSNFTDDSMLLYSTSVGVMSWWNVWLLFVCVWGWLDEVCLWLLVMFSVLCRAAVRASLCHLAALVPQLTVNTKRYQVSDDIMLWCHLIDSYDLMTSTVIANIVVFGLKADYSQVQSLCYMAAGWDC